MSSGSTTVRHSPLLLAWEVIVGSARNSANRSPARCSVMSTAVELASIPGDVFVRFILPSCRRLASWFGGNACSTMPATCDHVLLTVKNTSTPMLLPRRVRWSRTRPQLTRRLCLATAASAFFVGLVVGICLPLHASGVFSDLLRTDASSEASSALNNSADPLLPFGLHLSETVSGVYWTATVESLLPSGFSAPEAQAWRRFARAAIAVRVEEGVCGRMQNRLVTFSCGAKACCRYRQNADQIQGDIFSYHLGASVLGLQRNLPPATLSLVMSRDPRWSTVRGLVTLAQWREGKAVVLSQFVEGLEPAYIPVALRGKDRRLHPVAEDLSSTKTKKDLIELAQWSDLIVFDYLTANLDRVVNNLYNRQWNQHMMDAPAHNLARDPETGLLVFLDNESGLLHGYRLLDKYESYHETMLRATCIFRRSTVEALRRLHEAQNAGDRVRQVFRTEEGDEAGDWLAPLPDKTAKTLQKRVETVYEHMKYCEEIYANTKTKPK